MKEKAVLVNQEQLDDNSIEELAVIFDLFSSFDFEDRDKNNSVIEITSLGTAPKEVIPATETIQIDPLLSGHQG